MKIFLDSVGCRLNQSEIETYARQFRAAGHTLVEKAEQAELVVINTCTVTSAAASDSRQKIRRVVREGAKEAVVTGCWSTLAPAEAAALPGVRLVVPNEQKDRLVSQVLQMEPEVFEREFIVREPIPGIRLRTRAFIKVQDGCDNRCTFCITSLARGAARSRSVKEILIDIQAAVTGGVQEVVLTGVHLGSWGHDFSTPQHLSFLIKTILAETDVPRLRLSSLEPWDLEADFFSLWQDPRLCRHLHLPLQSGSAATLRRMARKTTPHSFANLVNFARSSCPDIAITTDIISGFPGETQVEFEETLDFIARMQFAGGHVFPYSPRLGTAAAKMPGQVPYAVRKTRGAQLMELLNNSAEHYQRRFLGQVLPTLWESAEAVGPEGWQVSGLTDNYLRVHAQTPQHMWNRISSVHLSNYTKAGLLGTIVD